MGDIADEHLDRLDEEGWWWPAWRNYPGRSFNRPKDQADKHAAQEFLEADDHEEPS